MAKSNGAMCQVCGSKAGKGMKMCAECRAELGHGRPWDKRWRKSARAFLLQQQPAERAPAPQMAGAA